MGERAPQRYTTRYMLIQGPPRAPQLATVMEADPARRQSPGGARTHGFRTADFAPGFFDFDSDYEITIAKVPRPPDPNQESAA
ncbi:MAG TPA: hypothetical protein VMK65_11800 [Longimicrobiales bacterium]|nr:hypothetical protein [Longimicrobiales bacterium]